MYFFDWGLYCNNIRLTYVSHENLPGLAAGQCASLGGVCTATTSALHMSHFSILQNKTRDTGIQRSEQDLPLQQVLLGQSQWADHHTCLSWVSGLLDSVHNIPTVTRYWLCTTEAQGI
jgi:hypothetical protein